MIADALVRHADRPAIEAADGSVVTYAELHARARRHASPALVEVPAERSVDFIARCLGAWLGGGAFFPVDRADPRARPRVELVDGLAYVIATSGSTGRPKLVMVGHGGLPALLRTQIDAFALGPGARSLWLHAPMFDASISDWGTALASGATLVIPTTSALTNLRAEIESRAITHVDLPPSLLGTLERPPRSLRVVVLGGEACDVERVRALARQVRVVVVYGPTEATVCSSLVVVDPDRWERALIGNPLPGVTYRVIDGELAIGGAALALGYASDPEETARRFVVVDGVRMYKTGDRVEPCEHGLAFVGRVDRQCKVAGRRVELDEIEAALRRFVDEAAVVVRAQRIVAFVERDVDRAALRRLLPPWMVPSRIVVGALPRTPTGKLDRAVLEQRALPPPELPSADPRERTLAAAWCQALGVDRVGRDDRFSEAGGDSLARLVFHVATDVAIEGDPTFGELVDHARRGSRQTMRVVDTERRGSSLSDSRPRADARRRDEGAVLVTGASGFLGRALVRAWRRRDRRPIVALVRDPAGVAELDVEHVRGDLSQRLFGLDDGAWHALRRRVSTVVHCGATVRLGGDWDDHFDANVRGTAEVAAFAGEDIAWHHVSTLSVFVNTDRAAGRHDERARPDVEAVAYGGYAQTKIAAEAIARTNRASIYRLGLLVGTEPRPRDQLQMTIRALAKLGAVPAGCRELRFDTTPVDYAAAAIAALALRAEHARLAETHHLAAARGMSCGELADRLRLQELPSMVWLERARARLDDPDIAMAIGSFSRRRDLDLFLATDADFAVERTAALLRELGIVMPPIDIVGAALEAG